MDAMKIAMVLCAVVFTFAIRAADKNDRPAKIDQPVDLAPWTYAWRADVAVQAKPEAYFIPHRKHFRRISSRAFITTCRIC
jgi:hypothetical protein